MLLKTIESGFRFLHFKFHIIAWDALMTSFQSKILNNCNFQITEAISGYFQEMELRLLSLTDSFGNYMAGVDPRRKWETCRATWRDCQQLAPPGRLVKCQHGHSSAFTCPITGPVSHSVHRLTDWRIPLAIIFRSTGQTGWNLLTVTSKLYTKNYCWIY